MPEQDTTPFEIIPLEGGYDTISLVGSALPYKGISFATEQRIKTTYYPGNPIATQTVVGPTKPNTTITGRWMDLTLSDGGARALIQQCEFLCSRAIPVEVRWGGRQLTVGVDPAIVRRGLIKRVDPKYNRSIDAEWSIEFEWRGEALQTKPPTFTAAAVKGDDFSAFAEQLTTTQTLTQSWANVVWAYIVPGANAMRVVADALNDVSTAIYSAVDVVNGATDMLQQTSELPSDIMDRIQGACAQVIAACLNARAALCAACGLWPGLVGVFTGATFVAAGEAFRAHAQAAKLALFPTDDPLTRLDGQTAQFSVIESWDALAEQAAITASSLAAQQVPDVIAIVRPPAGSDLRDLAQKYYSNPDQWTCIADYNGLDSSEVPATSTGPSDQGNPPIYVPSLAYYSSQLTNTWGTV